MQEQNKLTEEAERLSQLLDGQRTVTAAVNPDLEDLAEFADWLAEAGVPAPEHQPAIAATVDRLVQELAPAPPKPRPLWRQQAGWLGAAAAVLLAVLLPGVPLQPEAVPPVNLPSLTTEQSLPAALPAETARQAAAAETPARPASSAAIERAVSGAGQITESRSGKAVAIEPGKAAVTGSLPANSGEPAKTEKRLAAATDEAQMLSTTAPTEHAPQLFAVAARRSSGAALPQITLPGRQPDVADLQAGSGRQVYRAGTDRQLVVSYEKIGQLPERRAFSGAAKMSLVAAQLPPQPADTTVWLLEKDGYRIRLEGKYTLAELQDLAAELIWEPAVTEKKE